MEIGLISVNQMLGRFDPGGLVRLGGCSNRTYQQINTGSPVYVPDGRLAQSLPGFKFACRWQWPPGLWYAGADQVQVQQG